MYCKYCGIKIDNITYKFCKNCGEEIITQNTQNYGDHTFEQIDTSNKLKKNILIKSIDLLKINTYKNIHSFLLAIIAFTLIDSIEAVQNIPYIYVILKVIQCLTISLITMKIILTNSEFIQTLYYYHKSILSWILNSIMLCIVIEIIDKSLTTIGNLILKNVSYYNQGAFIDKFNFGMYITEAFIVDIIVTIGTYIFVFKISNIVKHKRKISLTEVFKNFKNNCIYIITLLLSIESVAFLKGFLLGVDGLINTVISITIVFIWIVLCTLCAYLNAENNIQLNHQEGEI